MLEAMSEMQKMQQKTIEAIDKIENAESNEEPSMRSKGLLKMIRSKGVKNNNEKNK